MHGTIARCNVEARLPTNSSNIGTLLLTNVCKFQSCQTNPKTSPKYQCELHKAYNLYITMAHCVDSRKSFESPVCSLNSVQLNISDTKCGRRTFVKIRLSISRTKLNIINNNLGEQSKQTMRAAT